METQPPPPPVRPKSFLDNALQSFEEKPLLYFVLIVLNIAVALFLKNFHFESAIPTILNFVFMPMIVLWAVFSFIEKYTSKTIRKAYSYIVIIRVLIVFMIFVLAKNDLKNSPVKPLSEQEKIANEMHLLTDSFDRASLSVQKVFGKRIWELQQQLDSLELVNSQ